MEGEAHRQMTNRPAWRDGPAVLVMERAESMALPASQLYASEPHERRIWPVPQQPALHVVQPPVRMGLVERVWRFVLRR
jgi:hypothetical protein